MAAVRRIFEEAVAEANEIVKKGIVVRVARIMPPS